MTFHAHEDEDPPHGEKAVAAEEEEERRKSEAPSSPEEPDSAANGAGSPPLPSAEEDLKGDVVSSTDLSTVRSESTQVDEQAYSVERSGSKDLTGDATAAAKDPDDKAAEEAAAADATSAATDEDLEVESTAETQVAPEPTSPLFTLPSSLLVRILELVGPHAFCTDVGRLAVCKQWLPLAQTVLFRELRLTPAKLERLFNRPSAKMPLEVVECVYLDLHGYWGVVQPASKEPPGSHEWDKQRKARHKWIDDLNRNMGKLRPFLKSCPNLWGLSIHPRSEQKPNAPKNAAATKESLRQYLDADKLLSLWQFQTLTVLELDLTFLRSPLKPPLVSAGKADPSHLCPRIAPLLRQLNSLTIRATEVCGELLLVPDSEINPKLLTIYIELGRMVADKDGPNWWKDVSQCECSRTWSPSDNFRAKMEQRLEQIARVATSPQRMWLTYVVPGDKAIVREAFDAVQQKRLRLGFESRRWEVKESPDSKA